MNNCLKIKIPRSVHVVRFFLSLLSSKQTTDACFSCTFHACMAEVPFPSCSPTIKLIFQLSMKSIALHVAFALHPSPKCKYVIAYLGQSPTPSKDLQSLRSLTSPTQSINQSINHPIPTISRRPAIKPSSRRPLTPH